MKKYNLKDAAHIYIKHFMRTHARVRFMIYTSLQTHSVSPVTDCTWLLVDMVPKLVCCWPSEPLSLDTLWDWLDQRQQAASQKRPAHCWRSCPGCIQQRMLWLAASAEPASLHTGTVVTLANHMLTFFKLLIFWGVVHSQNLCCSSSRLYEGSST